MQYTKLEADCRVTCSGVLLVGGGFYTLLIQLQTPATASFSAVAASDASSAAMNLVEHCH